ncbi:tRNA1Val (adenine37-N6)-methyltransferase [Prevotellaceae bacterium MN60]|nr:tRNA1Val (adenine37-N6)-methyltransferase [Prevotellaceae bacterium MN60]
MFQFKQFTIYQDLCAMKVGTDGVLLGAWANGGKRVLDAGTGTGIIALMMAQRYPNAVVTAIDVDEGAAKQAQQNVAQSPFSQQITVLHNTLQEHQGEYDAIISNPPFFIDSLAGPDEQRNVARHTQTLTYTELMQAAWRLLSDEGELSVVVPFDYRKRMEDEAIFVGFFPSKVCAVKTTERKPAKRYLLSFKKHPCCCEQEQLTIGSERYQELTKEFYL